MRQDRVRRDRNRAVRSTLRSAIKKVRRALEAGQVEEAKTLLPVAIKAIDLTAKKGVIHRNAAARNRSRLTLAVRKAESGTVAAE